MSDTSGTELVRTLWFGSAMTIAVVLRLSEALREDDGLAGEVEVVANGDRHRFVGEGELLRLLYEQFGRRREVRA